MAVIQLAITLIVLGFLYGRMIGRERPRTISNAQAVLPVVLGAAATFLSFVLFLGIGAALTNSGFSSQSLPGLIRSVIAAFVAAGLPEEVTKFFMLLLTLLIFRSGIKNVYEYILAGAGTGFGFTLLEEFLYGSSSGLGVLARLITIATHMVLGIIMARHLGYAKYRRIRGRGSAAGEYVLALLSPIVIHTLYDAGTSTNVFLRSANENEQVLGIVLGLASTAVMFVIQIAVLLRLKRDTEKYCAMKFSD